MENKDISRRDFIKDLGIGGVALGAAAAGCAPKSSKKASAEKTGEMEYRTNPKNGDKVSLLGYGCMRWQMKKDENGRDIVDQDSVNELVDYAISHGVNYFDSAPVYLQGQSEAATGKALSRHPRDSYFIATKLSNTRSFMPTFEESVQMYRQSFENFQTDHIDYYLLHNIGSEDVFNRRFVQNGVIDFLLAEREAGHIRNLGFSFHGQQRGIDSLLALHDKYHWDFIQIQMNYLDWTHADPGRNVNAEYLYQELDKREIPIVIMEPLLGGRLVRLPDNVANLLKGRDPDASLASWAFRFVGSHPRVLCALSGMTYMDNLIDNVNTFTGFKYMDQEELDFMEQMAALMADYPLIDCNNCQYCMPCEYGIDIPGILLHYNAIITEGTLPQSSEQKDFRKLRRHYLTTYSKAVETLRQADHCTGCRKCESHCPQSIKIADELIRIDAYIEKLKQNTL